MKRLAYVVVVAMSVTVPVGPSAKAVAARDVIVQSVIVEVESAESTVGTLRVVAMYNGVERIVLGPTEARVGRAGVKRNRKEGDGTTPIGSFVITGAFGSRTMARTALPYRRVVRGDCWISDVADRAYNTRVRRQACRTPNEDLHRLALAGPYEYALTTGYNSAPIVPGKGSAIFIHVHSRDSAGRTRPTSGCISVSRSVMRRLFALLDPAMNPVLVVRVKR